MGYGKRVRSRVSGLAVLLAARSAVAATQLWVPAGAGPFGYKTASNWNGGAGPVPGTNDTASMQIDLTANQSVTVSSAASLHQLDLGDAALTSAAFQNQSLSGSDLTFFASSGSAGGGIVNSQGGNNSIANNLIFPAAPSSTAELNVNVASGTLTLAGILKPAVNGNSVDWTINGPGTTIFSGTNANSVFGRVDSGTLRMGAANLFTGTSQPSMTIAAGATFELNNFDQTIFVLSTGSGTVNLGSATLTMAAMGGFSGFTGTVTGSGGLTFNASSSGIYADLYGRTFTYSGPTTIAGIGNVRTDASANLGNGSATNYVAFAPGNAAKLYAAGYVFTRNIILNGNGDLEGWGTGVGNALVTFSGDITGVGGLTVELGPVALTGNNNYSGDTFVKSGTLVPIDASLGSPASRIVLNGNGVLKPSGPFLTNRSFAVTTSFDNSLDPTGGDITFAGNGDTSFAGTLNVTGSGNLTFARAGGSTTVAGGSLIWTTGPTLVLAGTADTLTDGNRFVDLTLQNGPSLLGALRVTAGTKNVGVIFGGSTVRVENSAVLVATKTNFVSIDVRDNGTFQMRPQIAIPQGGQLVNLSIAPGAQFDMANDGTVWNYTGATVRPQLRTFLKNGRGPAALPTWAGFGGINSSMAAMSPFGQAVGYAENSDQTGGAVTTFMGVTGIDTTALLIRYTRTGDVNLDGQVNLSDLNILASFYLHAGSGEWYKGDVNYDDFVDDLDVSALARTWDPNITPPTHASLATSYGEPFAAAFDQGYANYIDPPSPEPSAIAVVMSLAGITTLRRRRWRD